MTVQPIDAHEQNDVTMDGATGTKMRMLVGPAEGAANFHMRHVEVIPGGHTPHHAHDYEHEILILSGEGFANPRFRPDLKPFCSQNQGHRRSHCSLP